MSDLHPTDDEIEAQLSPDAQVRVAEIKAWLSLEQKRLGIDADTPQWLSDHHREATWERLKPQLTEDDDEAIRLVNFFELLEDSYRWSQAEGTDPIVKVRRSDGEIVFYTASNLPAKLPPGDDVLPGQRTTVDERWRSHPG